MHPIRKLKLPIINLPNCIILMLIKDSSRNSNKYNRHTKYWAIRTIKNSTIRQEYSDKDGLKWEIKLNLDHIPTNNSKESITTCPHKKDNSFKDKLKLDSEGIFYILVDFYCFGYSFLEPRIKHTLNIMEHLSQLIQYHRINTLITLILSKMYMPTLILNMVNQITHTQGNLMEICPRNLCNNTDLNIRKDNIWTKVSISKL